MILVCISDFFSLQLWLENMAFRHFLVPFTIALIIGSSNQHKIHKLFTKLGVKVVAGYHITFIYSACVDPILRGYLSIRVPPKGGAYNVPLKGVLIISN